MLFGPKGRHRSEVDGGSGSGTSSSSSSGGGGGGGGLDGVLLVLSARIDLSITLHFAFHANFQLNNPDAHSLKIPALF